MLIYLIEREKPGSESALPFLFISNANLQSTLFGKLNDL
jgi:hypothetical protein